MRRRCAFALLAIVTGVPLAYGKGTPDLIIVSGGSLQRTIEITDSTALKSFSPWIGQFADWKAPVSGEAPCFRRSVEVLYYMKWEGRHSPLDRSDLKMIYAMRYCSDGPAGYVYLPGRG